MKIKTIADFELPPYQEIPDVGLYLEQTVKYIGSYMEAFDSVQLTGSMISNYVKKKIIVNTVKKQYNREQIAYLFFIAMAKTVVSLENIQLLIQTQQSICDVQDAYSFFRIAMKETLQEIAGEEKPKRDYSDAERMLHHVVAAIGQKLYLDQYLTELQASQDQED